jgi:hypothetical protein
MQERLRMPHLFAGFCVKVGTKKLGITNRRFSTLMANSSL